MGTPLSLLLFAFGAILAFAVRSDPSGLSLTAVGVILMIVAAIGYATTLYRDQWRRKIVEESIEQGTPPPSMSLEDDTVLVDPSAPYEAPYRPEADLAHPQPHHHHAATTAPLASPVVNVNLDQDRP